jgi:hypothetical protein
MPTALTLRPFSPIALGLVLALAASPAQAQEAPPQVELALAFDSGPVANTSARRAVVISHTVRVEGAAWLRLAFRAVDLAGDPEQGTGALLRITSFADGAVQELDARHVAEWQATSAYFNGDTLQVDVEALPGSGPSRTTACCPATRARRARSRSAARRGSWTTACTAWARPATARPRACR